MYMYVIRSQVIGILPNHKDTDIRGGHFSKILRQANAMSLSQACTNNLMDIRSQEKTEKRKNNPLNSEYNLTFPGPIVWFIVSLCRCSASNKWNHAKNTANILKLHWISVNGTGGPSENVHVHHSVQRTRISYSPNHSIHVFHHHHVTNDHITGGAKPRMIALYLALCWKRTITVTMRLTLGLTVNRYNFSDEDK
jgi:hypothetical protein